MDQNVHSSGRPTLKRHGQTELTRICIRTSRGLYYLSNPPGRNTEPSRDSSFLMALPVRHAILQFGGSSALLQTRCQLRHSCIAMSSVSLIMGDTSLAILIRRFYSELIVLSTTWNPRCQGRFH
ncbi:hypothetical protein FALCPG4_015878 [Fusarium falciforme]|nr:hypothetical protein NW759_017302 [Fusarium solani]